MRAKGISGLAVLAAAAALGAAGASTTRSVGVTNNTRHALTATLTAYDSTKDRTQTFSQSIDPGSAYLFRLADGVRPVKLGGTLTVSGAKKDVPARCINTADSGCSTQGYDIDSSWMLTATGSDYAFTPFPAR